MFLLLQVFQHLLLEGWGLILGDSALDINVHDTYFVVGHFRIMGLSAIYGMLASLSLVPKNVAR